MKEKEAKLNEVWVCQDCCWHNGNGVCLVTNGNASIHNDDGGCWGTIECVDYVMEPDPEDEDFLPRKY